MDTDNSALAALLMGRGPTEEVQRRRSLMMMPRPVSTEPVASPLEGLARVLQGGLQGYMAGQNRGQQFWGTIPVCSLCPECSLTSDTAAHLAPLGDAVNVLDNGEADRLQRDYERALLIAPKYRDDDDPIRLKIAAPVDGDLSRRPGSVRGFLCRRYGFDARPVFLGRGIDLASG